MDIENFLKQKISNALDKLNIEYQDKDIVILKCKDNVHGDYSTNVAMRYASLLKKSPSDIAKSIIEIIDKSGIDKIEVAGPGFINFFISNNSLSDVVAKIIKEGHHYGDGQKKNLKINIEFVSANPTGYLHLGHARNAAIGDSISRILIKDGYDVTKEYYINDAGNQINNLGRSILARYQELEGQKIEFDDDMYRGHEIIEIAKLIKANQGNLLNEPNALQMCMEKGKELLLQQIIDDLDLFRVKFDVFSYETKIRSDHAVENELKQLERFVYQSDGALLLKTSQFLDDKDRVIVKSNGDYTYFLPDIVYHLNKLSRGFDYLIDVLGADHHGYINRMKSVLMMHGYSQDVLDIELIQMVRIFKDGSEMKLSKRTGQTITLRELCEEAGVDAVRYFFVARSAAAHLDFDIDLARQQNSSNPVYYAQYAHARLCSVLKKIGQYGLDETGHLLQAEKEMNLLKILIDYPQVVKSASQSKQPYIITNYIQKLASAIHGFYTECRIIDDGNIPLTKCRLALAKASQIVIANSLNLIGVNAPCEM